MKTSKLKNIAWVFFALILASTTVFAQGYRNGNRVQNNQNLPCVKQISNLTDKQVQEIKKLEASHQETIAGLRTQRRSTNNEVEKSEIRTEMLKKGETHRSEVKNLLSAEQQKEYDLLQINAGNSKKQRFAQNGNGCNRGNGNFANNGNRRCKGNGNNARFTQNRGRGNNCIQNNKNRNCRNRNFRGFDNNSKASNS